MRGTNTPRRIGASVGPIGFGILKARNDFQECQSRVLRKPLAAGRARLPDFLLRAAHTRKKPPRNGYPGPASSAVSG
jgi:hypothetical protein